MEKIPTQNEGLDTLLDTAKKEIIQEKGTIDRVADTLLNTIIDASKDAIRSHLKLSEEAAEGGRTEWAEDQKNNIRPSVMGKLEALGVSEGTSSKITELLISEE